MLTPAIASWRLLLSTAVLALTASACIQAQGGPDPTGNGTACTPGASQPCACSDGSEGAQTCHDDGSRFFACECATTKDEAGVDSRTEPTIETGSTDTATPETALDAAPDPCGGIPSTGKCIGDTVAICATPTGSSTPKLTTWACKSYEECRSASGYAFCALKAGACYPGTTRCSGSSLLTCGSSATWTTTACSAGCLTTDVGSSCAGTGTTSVYSGTLEYEFKEAGTTDWSSTWTAKAQQVLIVSYNGTAVVDYTTTSSTGTFSLKVPSVPSKTTTIRAWLLGRHSDGSLAFAVARPGFTTTGQHSTPETSDVKSTANIVNAAWDPVTFPSGSKVSISASNGGGYLRVYDYLRYAHGAAEYATGRFGRSVVAWMQPNVSWDCGACYNGTPASVSNDSFSSQIWIPMIASDESYWSDSVTAHEVGHWAMDSFGRSPTEGGKHFLNCATFPGQAWSEGWATLFSSMARDNPRYTDKQSGTYFWFDIATRTSSGAVWPMASPTDTLLQQIAENEVAAIGWRLTAPRVTTDSTRLESNRRMFRALSSSRMTVAPFARGYKRHSWEVVGTSCAKSSVYEYSYTVPMFADFLDALLCGGEATDAEVQAAVDPSKRYPYYPFAKLCK